MLPRKGSSYSTSTSVRVSSGIGRGGIGKSVVRHARDAPKRSKAAKEKIRGALAGLDYQAREELSAMDIDAGNWEDDPVMGPIPPGDEGVLSSHAGGETALCIDLMLDSGKRRDGRNRRNRIESRNVQWAAQLPALTDAYLSWKYLEGAADSNVHSPEQHPAQAARTGASGSAAATGTAAGTTHALPPRSSTSASEATRAQPPRSWQSAAEAAGTDGPFTSTSVTAAQVPSATTTAARPARDHTPLASTPVTAAINDDEDAPVDEAAGVEGHSWDVFVIDFFATATSTFTPSSSLEMATITLAKRGYLAVAPVYPTRAVSFKVLEAYRQLHGACPRMSIHAFCQALCGLHLAVFRRTFAEQFSIAFDVYLDILHAVDKRVNTALARDTSNWRMLNACAPCLYKLDNEEPLAYDILVSMDGNSSLKLVDDQFRSGYARADSRTCRTDLFISPEEVDRFKDEVQNAGKPPSAPCQPPPPSGEVANNGETEMADLAVEPADSNSVCAERWRNAGPEARKKMFALFQATGVFVCICRHGHVLVMCDMIRSGELMKYGLSIVDKLIEVYGPSKVKVGYDIGCEFNKTMTRSSLGPKADGVISCVVPAFHGHSHNRGCQVQWHPLYMHGVGKEDFEGCERLFSFLNGVAGGTRLASSFHRHQAIEGAVGFWDLQKHLASGKFLYENYRQALEIIKKGESELAEYARVLKTTPADYERYLQEERAFLDGVRSEPLELSLKCQYLEALQHLEAEGVKDTAAAAAHARLDYMIIHEGIIDKQIRAIEREYINAHDRVARAEVKVRRLEDLLDISRRWLPSSREYKEVAQELVLRKYRRALDNLEHLVVQRLFELKKLGMNGVGYKQREKIGHALKSRAQAIRNALTAYNKEAAALSPPRQQLSWTEVMDMVCIGEFDLLRDARTDIRQEDWAKPRHREAMNVYYNVQRAREEIQRANVEIARLFTAMIDDYDDLTKAIERARESDPHLSLELVMRRRYQNALNAHVVRWLNKASDLPGFTGRVVHGHRVGRDPSRVRTVSLPPWATHSAAGSNRPDADDPDADEGAAYDLEDGDGIPGMGGAGASGRFVQFVDNLSGGGGGGDDVDTS